MTKTKLPKGLTIEELITATEEYDKKNPTKRFFTDEMTYQQKYDLIRDTLETLEEHGFVGSYRI